MFEISGLLLTPVFTGLTVWGIRNKQLCEWIHLFGSVLTVIFGLKIAYFVFTGTPFSAWNDFIYIDALSAFNISITMLVSLTAALYSIGYIRHELHDNTITGEQFHRYYLWYHFFIVSMLGVSVTNNIGFLWVAIELTTLVSALLVGFYQRGTSLEAAWKYLIMGSVGIAFALLGIILLYISGIDVLGEEHQALNWTVLNHVASMLNPQWMTLAFIFILVGFGTKAGFAPMHFWLPDAHSQAPSPISAVLSGVLLNTAFYGILRIYVIANQTLGASVHTWLLGFGLLSVAITVPFILVQHDLKRMLAYSSVEHMGIITLGIGIGGPLGIYGALLHMFNHSMTKSLLFLAAGNLNQVYHSKRMDRILGMIKTTPVTGILFVIAIFAITGLPPFNLFVSEFTIMLAGFRENSMWASILFIIFIGFIFAGMLFYTMKMAFGQTPLKVKPKPLSKWSTTALFIPLIFVIGFGIYVPSFMTDILNQVALILKGAGR
ncbi:MAG TPA: hydrogenase 4 subunit F [Bacillota bacterium]|nr:hydrogenase 4 subunit F [Bacillota bacterium]